MLLAALSHPAVALDSSRRLTQCMRRIWQVQQGLPQATIFVVRQTTDGYLWLGTPTGLVRFDGVQFTTVDSSGDAPLARAWIRDLAEDAASRLWVATDSSGVVRLEHGDTRRYSTADGLPSDHVGAVLCDRAGTVWAGTDRGLARSEQDRFIAVDRDDAQSPQAVSAICEAPDGTLWVAGAGKQLRSLHGGRWQTHTIDALPQGATITALAAAPDGTLWIGTSHGLVRRRENKFDRFTRTDGLPDDQVSTLALGHDGVLWIGTKDGFCRLYRGDFESFRSRDGLSQSTVYTLCEDREGSLWVGTKHGLNQFLDRRTIPFTTSEGLPSNNTGPVFEDREGTIWIGTLDAGLASYDGRRFSALTTIGGLASNRVLALAGDEAAGLWVGTDRGLSHLVRGRVERTFTTADGLPSDAVHVICRDRRGTLWVGTARGVARLKDGKFISPQQPSSDGDLSVQALVDSPWGLLVAARGDQLYVATADKVEPFRAARLAANDIDALYTDSQGLLWIGTRGDGLLMFDGKRMVQFTPKDGLYDDDIFGITADEHGTLWMACSKGIFSVARDELLAHTAGKLPTLASMPFSATDALRTIECAAGVKPDLWIMRDGHIWFSTMHGVMVIDPEHVRRVLPPMPVFVEKMLVNGQSQPLSTTELPPGHNNIEFHYTALSFAVPTRTFFRYRLDGFDSDWVDAGTRREAFYTNLPPGQYRFRVVARGVDQKDYQPPSPVAFTILPHFYQRRWFLPLCAGVAALLALAGLQLRVRQVRTQMRAVLAERTRIARELHDTLMQGFSGVTMEMQALAARIAESPQRRTLEEIIRDASACLREARQSLVGLRTGRRGASGLSADIARAAQQMADAHGVRLKLHLGDVPRALEPDVQYNLLRIAQEALSNAMHHAQASMVEVTLECTPRELSLSVKDDGAGMAVDVDGARSGHFGIVGMRERAAEIGARFELVSRQGEGTAVSVILPAPTGGTAARHPEPVRTGGAE